MAASAVVHQDERTVTLRGTPSGVWQALTTAQGGLLSELVGETGSIGEKHDLSLEVDVWADGPGYGAVPAAQGELATMGTVIAASSAWAILKGHRVEPSPRRSGSTWAGFLAAQAKELMACDLFQVDTVLLRMLYVLVFIHHETRPVRIAGVTATPVADG